jgi:hypothetical protein
VQIKNRIKELRQVKASELLPNPKNWRRHPTAQRSALLGALGEIGYADALIAYETEEGLMLIDGHLRASTTPDTEVPVLVTDLNEHEAGKLMATLDPLAALAETDHEKLKELRNYTMIEDETLKGVVDKLLLGNMLFLERALQADETGEGVPFPKFESLDEDIIEEDDLNNFSMRVTSEQRTEIMAAVNSYKKIGDAVTTAEALASICRRYSAEQ